MEYTKHNTFKENSNIWSLQKHALVLYLIFQIYTKKYLSINGCYDFNRTGVGFISTVVCSDEITTTNAVSSTPYCDDLCSSKPIMVKLVNHLLDVDGFPWELQFLPLIKLISSIYMKHS